MSQDAAREGMEETGRPNAEAFGPWLRRQREIRQIQLQEIADRTKISVRYLKAMEQDRFELLPGAVFAKGFLREYARYVGLNPDEVVNFYLSTREEDPDEAEMEPETVSKPRSRVLPIVLVILLLAAVLLLGWFWIRYMSERSSPADPPEPRAEQTAPVPNTPEPAPVEADARVQPPETPASEDVQPGETSESGNEVVNAASDETAPLELTLDFREDCWVEARIDGSEILSQRFAQGESLQISANERVEFLALGNAGGVSLQVNGKPYSLDATSGEVLRNVTFDLETARRLEERGR